MQKRCESIMLSLVVFNTIQTALGTLRHVVCVRLKSVFYCAHEIYLACVWMFVCCGKGDVRKRVIIIYLCCLQVAWFHRVRFANHTHTRMDGQPTTIWIWIGPNTMYKGQPHITYTGPCKLFILFWDARVSVWRWLWRVYVFGINVEQSSNGKINWKDINSINGILGIYSYCKLTMVRSCIFTLYTCLGCFLLLLWAHFAWSTVVSKVKTEMKYCLTKR